MGPLSFLDPINTAASALKSLVDVWSTLRDRRDRQNASIAADLTALLEELRRTHSTIVKMVSPLRRVDDDPMAFPSEFQQVYNDFRDFYDAYDFGEERTRCHKIFQIQNRMQQRRPRFGSSSQWDQLYVALGALGTADFDIIDTQYKPFMARFDEMMKKIDQDLRDNETTQAILEKNAFLGSLDLDYERNKAMLEEMTNIVGKLTMAL